VSSGGRRPTTGYLVILQPPEPPGKGPDAPPEEYLPPEVTAGSGQVILVKFGPGSPCSFRHPDLLRWNPSPRKHGFRASLNPQEVKR